MNDLELFAPGHRMCVGCTAPIIVRWVLKYAGPKTIVVTSTGCLEVSTTPYPQTAWRVPWIHVAFENAAAVASGIEAALKALGRDDVNVIVFSGDGGTVDIGFQALSGMLERRHNVLYVLYDNEAYMNTGIQRSGATPYGAWTTTSQHGSKIPVGKTEDKKPIAMIVAAHNPTYVATANPAIFSDFINKVKKALSLKGPRFLHVISSCCTGWRFEPSKAIKIMRLATETGLFPLWEWEGGPWNNIKITYVPKERKPVAEYLKLQGRFKHLSDEDIDRIQKMVDEWWKGIEKEKH